MNSAVLRCIGAAESWLETLINGLNQTKVTMIFRLKRRIERFYVDEDGYLVVALYIFIEGNHTFDTDKYTMLSQAFLIHFIKEDDKGE
ncbi:hypothetical protein JOD82_002056 [Paenibacillus sp. 1182]|uniref:hypothetical protein n=1 Tax=Paenibacillus sp. 1182 TaxID=2806565 RepID=UPI001AE2D18E|nr:hypothetical protein [Paenibacillus sp. 1182]MBP1309036.1 hypothetical protein [Paenibacillus sp. 1182]